jgi:hypothetical protein
MTAPNAPGVGMLLARANEHLIGAAEHHAAITAAVAHLSRLEEQLAQAQAGMRRRGDDMIVPMRLLDEINASGYAWKVRAEAAEAEVERLRAAAAMLADDFQGCGDHSRHKQAAEAWHYCAKKIRAALATQTGEKG